MLISHVDKIFTNYNMLNNLHVQQLHVNVLIKIVNMGNQHVFTTFYKTEKNNFKKIKLK